MSFIASNPVRAALLTLELANQAQKHGRRGEAETLIEIAYALFDQAAISRTEMADVSKATPTPPI